jgi:putative membrane protein
MSTDKISVDRFKVMERKLYRGIMMPSMILVIVLGTWLVIDAWEFYKTQGWLYAKLALIVPLIVYHFYCGYLLQVFKRNENSRSDVFYRWFNEFPVLILVAIIILVVVKPF